MTLNLPTRAREIRDRGVAGRRTAQQFAPPWCLYLLTSITVLWAVAWAKAFLIPLALALFLACCLAPVVKWLEWLRLPRIIGSAVVVLLLAATAVVGTLSLRDDATALIEELPVVTRQLADTVNGAMNQPDTFLHRIKLAFGLKRGADLLPVTTSPLAGAGAATPAQMAVVEGSKTVVSLLSDAAAIGFLTFFLLASGTMWEQKILRSKWGSIPGRTVAQIVEEIRLQMQRYLGVMVLTNTALGLLIWAAFRALGVSHAEVWGVAAALLHVIPYIGPAVIAIGSGLVASMQFESVAQGLLVGGITLLMSTIIGLVLTTWLAGRASRMNTTVVFVSLLLCGWLWGLSGVLLATPITMALKVVCGRLKRLAWIDYLLGDEASEHAVTADKSAALESTC